MEIYLVGGAVRDTLLGRLVQDRDWVVTGATREEMLAKGYQSVGKDFPVFLHPETQEEYALARLERKVAKGYHGFEFNVSNQVTIEEDLSRRDLTINAIAQSAKGQLIDPYHGQHDIEARVLRHVSEAFSEDPVRILRVARFAARYHLDGFTVAPETMQLMQSMVEAGEVDTLVAERVWQEMEKALAEPAPEVFIAVLQECGALAVLLPELEALFGVPQVETYHPEIDTGIHTLMVLQQAVQLSKDVDVRFAALMHDLGKGTTPIATLPHHYGHEIRGVDLLRDICNRFKVSKKYSELAILVARYHTHIHKAFELKPKTLLKVLRKCDAYRRPERFKKLLLACQADARGRLGFEQAAYTQSYFYWDVLMAAQSVDVSVIVKSGVKGEKIQQELHAKRLSVVKQLIADSKKVQSKGA